MESVPSILPVNSPPSVRTGRVFAVTRNLGGDERRQAVVHHLRDSLPVVEVPTRIPRLVRILNVARSFRPSRESWRETSKKNPFYFRAASRTIRTRALTQGFTPPDVVLTFEALFSPGLGAQRLRPFVMYEDGTSRLTARHWPNWVPPASTTEAYRRLEEECYRGTDLILTTNEAVRGSLISDYQVAPGAVVNIGQGHDFPENGSPASTSSDPPILFVGYEFERKGGPVLLEAFRQVRHRIPTARLFVVGPILSLSEPGVTVLGPVQDKRRLRELYCQAGLFVLPSIFDPMPHAALEAMSCGVPVVVSDGCGTRELLEDGVNGLIVRVGDVEGLARRMTDLLADVNRRRRIGAAGAQTVMERCSWPVIAARVATLLQELAAVSTQRNPARRV